MADLAFNIAGTVLEKLGSLAYEEISLAWGMKDDLKKLEKTTELLKAVLLDAEKKQDENEQLRLWLSRLKHVFHDAQDMLDEFECELLRRGVVKEYGRLGRKVRRFFSRSNPVVFHFSIAHQIKKIRQELDEIAKEMNKFQLISVQLNQEQRHLMQRTKEMTHSYVNASDVIGRDIDKEIIIEMLKNQDHNGSDNNISVIPIVGIGGLGKTTLAKSIYNDERVVDCFNLRLWVCAPSDLNVTETIREILKSAITAMNTSTNENFSMDHSLKNTNAIMNLSLDQLQVFLRSILKEKKFLLIFDDVWNEDRSKWSDLKEVLSVGAKDSKIVVTTRNTQVASIMGTTPLHQLQGLTDEHSLSFFLKCAFGDEQLADQFPRLKEIGTQIVRKCRGVPLAVKTLGSLLNKKTDESDWIHIRDNEIWELNRDRNDHILSALRLSYSTMPSYLKQGFSYCSLIPKSTRLCSTRLIWMWMALGLLQSPNDNMELEDIGKLYFKEFCARSFFQYLYNDEELSLISGQEFEMHDLIYDLAVSIIQDERSTVNSSTKNIAENVRYLTLFLNDDNGQTILRNLQKLKKVQSIILMFAKGGEETNIDLSFISTLISRFRYLRLFDLNGFSFEVLPNSIGSLKHLRYLGLVSNKKIKKLPDSICKLQNLQTLWLAGCEELEELPRDIKNLVSLRTLTLTTKQMYLSENGVGRLKSLRYLVLVSCNNLRHLPHDMRYCTTLQTLMIGDCVQLDLASGPIDDEVVQLSLQTLAIRGLPQTTALPHWLQGATNTLQNLIIEDCSELSSLPEWLPNLTSLEKLAISECPKLLSLPEGMQRLTSLKHLRIEDCEALEERCKRDVGQDWPKIAHIPNVNIGDESNDSSEEDSG